MLTLEENTTIERIIQGAKFLHRHGSEEAKERMMQRLAETLAEEKTSD